MTVTRIHFAPDTTGQLSRLRKQVMNSITPDMVQKATRLLHAKMLLLSGSYILFFPLIWISYAGSWYLLCPALMGILSLPLVLNAGHEAVHRTSKQDKVNAVARHVFYLLGTSAWFWELRHLSSHHACVNICGQDLDISQSALIRLDKTQPHKTWHRWQHAYMPFAFLLYTLSWFFIRDFADLRRHTFGQRVVKSHPAKEVLLLFVAKAWHLAAFLFIPYVVCGSWQQAFAGFLLFHASASLVTTFALISAHIGEEHEMPLPQDPMPYSWLEHQLRTTSDFCTQNSFILHFFGGFNHHVAHHLFPNIPHTLYPTITRHIREFCELNALPYYCHDTLFKSGFSHFRRLQQFSLNETA